MRALQSRDSDVSLPSSHASSVFSQASLPGTDCSEISLPESSASLMPGETDSEDDTVVSLPSDVDLDDTAEGLHCQCKLRCHTKFSKDAVAEHRAKRLGSLPNATEDASSYGQMQRLWEKVKACANVNGRSQWKVEGVPVCRKWFQHYNAVSQHTVDDIR